MSRYPFTESRAEHGAAIDRQSADLRTEYKNAALPYPGLDEPVKPGSGGP